MILYLELLKNKEVLSEVMLSFGKRSYVLYDIGHRRVHNCFFNIFNKSFWGRLFKDLFIYFFYQYTCVENMFLNN